MGPLIIDFEESEPFFRGLYIRNLGKVAFLIEYVTETSGTSISINFISTV